ncbi:hypothetical protein ASF84_19765 [Pseudomonas sp. Leaf127]|nr:hypothetical protein ASF84_19765 [Pseudomonas sp. Leaf127]
MFEHVFERNVDWRGRRLVIACEPFTSREDDMENLKAGDLDPGFGQGGRLELGEGRSSMRFRKFSLDHQHRILGVGTSEKIGAGTRYVTVGRFTADGVLDTSFDDSGYWLSLPVTNGIGGIDVGSQTGEDCILTAVPSDRVILLYRTAEGQVRERPLTRENVSVDGNGVVAVQGRLNAWIACSYLESARYGRVLLMRLRSEGHPDNGFAQDGILILGEGTQSLQLRDMTVRPAEHDVILAMDVTDDAGSGAWLYCLDSDTGELKETFASQGRFPYSVSGYPSTVFSRVFHDKERLWLTGYVRDPGQGVMRGFFLCLTSSGEIDKGFNQGEPIIIQAQQAHIGVQRDGKVLLVDLQDDSYTLRRYLPDGELDLQFGQGGQVAVGRSDEYMGGLLVQPDEAGDKIILSAYASGDRSISVALYRFLS